MNTEFSRFEQGSISGYLHLPATPTGQALVITHGAGGNAAAPLLVKVAAAFAAVGITVLRFDLPFRQRRPKGPPSPARAVQDRINICDAANAMRARGYSWVFAGGQSYGGRQTSMLAAEKPDCIDGLLLLSYPLHPPGKTQTRTAHFPAIHTPALFVQGTRDPFGTPDEIREAIALIPARPVFSPVDQAGHDLKAGKFDIPALIVEPFLKLFA
jgi:predicted alpha/beta-hydrolase family hydrolase